MINFFQTITSQSGGLLDSLKTLWQSTGLNGFVIDPKGTFLQLACMAIACVLLYLAIVKEFEPNLLLAIAFGMFIINIPGAYEVLYYPLQRAADGALVMINGAPVMADGNTSYGLFYYLYKGVDWVIFPPLIFLGIGAMTDFGPLIANPKSLLMGAAAQLGIFLTLIGALLMGDTFTAAEAAAIAIIGGADGPTAIYVTQKLAAHLMPAIAIAAYSYMALVPVI
ncbi:MAG: sodium ion-translocating decarboxylase subunit beta, partial [Clostridia bacterium]